MWRFLGWLFLAALVYVVGAEATSQVLYGSEFVVEGGSNSLSDVQDWIVLFWPIWVLGTAFLVVAALIWLVPKLPGAARWTVRHLRYIKSPRRLKTQISEGRKRDRLHAEWVAQLEKERAQKAAAEEAAATKKAEAERRRRANMGLRSSIKSRIPKDADDFESVCAEWVVKCGIAAQRTDKGPDGGLDVIGPDFAGQCKFHPSNKVGAPDVQQLAGAATQARKQRKVFFHYGPGYTPAAIEAARSLGVQLWEMDVDQHTFRKVD